MTPRQSRPNSRRPQCGSTLTVCVRHWFQSIGSKQQILDDSSPNEVFLDDPLGVLRRDVLVPRPLGVDHADRPAGADAEAVALGAVAGAVLAGEVQVFETSLDVVPGSLAD